MTLRTSVLTEIKEVSRAGSLTESEKNQLASSALIWISNSKKQLLYKYNGIGDFPADGLTLPSGGYLAEAWVGDSVPASWDKVRYHGSESFNITAGATTQVNVKCPVRNTLVTLNIDENLKKVLSDISFTVSLNDGITDGSHSLVFEGDKINETGYFMINTRTDGFNWTLAGTDVKGQSYSKSDRYIDPDVTEKPHLARATHYTFNIKYNQSQGDIEIGGIYFDIDVVPEPNDPTHEIPVEIAVAPEIKDLYGRDLSTPLQVSPGNVGTQTLHIVASSPLTSVVIEGEMLKNIAGAADYDLLNMDASHVTTLDNAGIKFTMYKGGGMVAENSSEATSMRIDILDKFLNTLPVGNHSLNVTATDNKNKTSSAALSLAISNAPGSLNPASSTTYTSAAISAEIKEPGTRMGFEVKRIGTARIFEDWTFVEGSISGSILSASLSDLDPGTQYAYRLIVDDYTSLELTFSTPSYPQLPNSGFEDWSKPAKPYLIYTGSENNMFWDSGNHGSTTISADGSITTPDSSIKHSGNYSAKLKSTFIGVGALGKFAAGNIFTGKYLTTDGMDGVLGWGRPWDMKPKALRGWIKYTPATVTSEASDYAALKKGDMDKGIIYIALLDGTTEEATDSKNNSFDYWPVVVRTKKTGRTLFDKNASNVVAYGEMIFDSATPGDGMVEFTIPLNDVNGSLEVRNIMIVASASIGGDYFVGGKDSTMWLDDLELVY